MASLEIAKDEVEITITKEVLVYTLQLSEAEAKFLYFVMGSIGGCMRTSARKLASSIANVLPDDLDIERGTDHEMNKYVQPNNRAIFFKDNTLKAFEGETR